MSIFGMVDWENNCGMSWADDCRNKIMYKCNTAVGLRYFCSEVCYAIYIGVPIKEEGYYSLERIE